MRLCSKKQRGFTLVEVIVVLVILAILATVMIPSLTGYIDKANERGSIAQCRQCVLAAQTLAAERYAAKQTLTLADDKTALVALAEAPAGSDITALDVENGKVSRLVYVSAGGVTVTYADGKYTLGAAADRAYTAAEAPAAIADVLESLKSDPAIATLGNNQSLYSGAPGSPATAAAREAFVNALPADLKNSLAGKTWAITTTAAGFGSYKLAVYDGDISALGSGIRLSVNVYDSRTGDVTTTDAYTGTATVGGTRYPILTWF